jgi:UDP-glucose 4-epimerase
MTRFLKEREAPVLLGFDPMMQVIHEDDVVSALAHAVLNDVPGVYNVAAQGPLHLSRITALGGKLAVPVFHLLAYWGAGAGGSRFMPMELDYLRYRWVADVRKMNDALGFTPQYTAVETLQQFAKDRRMKPYLSGPDALNQDEERLREIMAQRQRAREDAAGLLFEEIIEETEEIIEDDAALDGRSPHAADFRMKLSRANGDEEGRGND